MKYAIVPIATAKNGRSPLPKKNKKHVIEYNFLMKINNEMKFYSNYVIEI
jgi:hypothetical protein